MGDQEKEMVQKEELKGEAKEAEEAEATEFPDTTLSMNFSSARGLEFKAVAPSNFPSQVDSATTTTTEAAAASTNSDETTTAGGGRPSFSRQETAKHKKKSKRDQ